MENKYNPQEAEPRIYDNWEKSGYFHIEPEGVTKPYTIVIPPPNVTGVLHLGHAMDNTFQDIIIRWRRMQGWDALWVPGTDHAGIATQNVVERQIKAQENKTRHDLGREKFIEKVWEWKEDKGSTITRQLRRLGCSCDWQRERFTMDAGLSKAVEAVFIEMHRRGWIYRGKYLINWCPRCLTALSNEEAIPKDISGGMWYIKYPMKDGGGHITVATTRPETMLGDTAVAVNPSDERYKDMVGKIAILPFVDRELPIVADHHVKYGGEEGAEEVGTGALKVTPAHDPHDFEIGKRHDLAQVNIFTADGNIIDDIPEFGGMERFQARKAIVARLEEMGLLEKFEEHPHAVPHCHRCSTILEPRLSTQWFAEMKPMADLALEKHESGEIRWHPERWGGYYERWMREIRDWCISRQLWWGHRIPAWYCSSCDSEHILEGVDGTIMFEDKAQPIVSARKPEKCERCGSADHLVQDPDVLDTWFSSWLWPFSTLGWPEETADMKAFYPTQTLVTGPDIIFFWVARMIMSGIAMTGKAPFFDVYVHGMVTDENGQIMSKSKGNGIDPLEMIDKYSADAIRLSLVMLTSEGQDCRISEKRINQGNRLCIKLWNAARLVLTNMEGYDGSAPDPAAMTKEDKWILSCLARAAEHSTDAMERFRFNEAVMALYDFFWHDFCDWYLEMVKPRYYDDAGDARAKTCAQAVSSLVLDNVLRLLHPYIPFVTEEIRSHLKEAVPAVAGDSPTIMRADWPATGGLLTRDESIEGEVNALIGVVTRIRELRTKFNVKPGLELDVAVGAVEGGDSEKFLAAISEGETVIKRLAKVGKLTVNANVERPADSAAGIAGGLKVYVVFGDAIDFEQERTRLKKNLAAAVSELGKSQKKLSNPNFVDRAAPDAVEKERRKEAEAQAEIDAINSDIAALDQ